MRRCLAILIAFGSIGLSGCIIASHSEAVPAPVHEQRSCNLSRPLDVHLRVIREESAEFKRMVEEDSDSATARIERRAKERMASVFASWILADRGLAPTDRANLNIVVRIGLISRLRDGMTDARSAGATLACLTLAIFPFYYQNSEAIQVEYYAGNQLVQHDYYPIERSGYISWLMIPWNLLYVWMSPTWGVTDDTIDYEEVLRPHRRALEINTHNALCAMRASQRENPRSEEEGPPLAEEPRKDPGGSLEGGVD